jgi:hypothetical protein
MARTTKPAAEVYKAAAPGDDRIAIVCFYCGKEQHVGRRAMSLPCRFCHKSLRVENISLNRYEARKLIETCGSITIENSGNVLADQLTCGSLVVRGQLKGNVISRGPVVLDASACVRGDISAPSLTIIEGARIDGRCRIGPPPDQAGR